MPGDGVAGVDGPVYASLVWDRDGAGSMPPLLVIGGSFSVVGDTVARNLAAYDPATGAWSEFAGGIERAVTSLAALPNGDLVVGGFFSWIGSGTYSHAVARWNGTSWLPMGWDFFRTVYCLHALPNGDLLAGGNATTYDGCVARWNGSYWTRIGVAAGGAYSPVVYAVAALPNGDVVVGGYFTSVGSVVANCVARWDGANWSALGAGVAGSLFYPTPSVKALAVSPNGDLLVGGNFLFAGGTAAHGVARWDGANWSSVGTGWAATVSSLLPLPNGDVVAGGYTQNSRTNVARWDGSAWTTLGAGVSQLPLVHNATPSVYTLARMPNGDLFAGGSFREAGSSPANCVARWDGASWSGMAVGTNGPMRAVATLPNGDVVAGGDFTAAGGVAAKSIARWNGATWAPMGLGMSNDPSATSPPSVRAIAVMPNGDVVAGGDFTYADGLDVGRVARWDGAAWAPLGSGMDEPVKALLVLPNGDLLAGGEFTVAGGVPASCIARWDGTSWWPLGAGLSRSASLNVPAGVYALAVLANGDVLAGGCFTRAGTAIAEYIARWDGTDWHAISSSMTGPSTIYTRPGVFALTPRANGDVLVGGWFEQVDGVAAGRIARWNGAGWAPFGAGIQAHFSGYTPAVDAIVELPNGDLLVGGDFLGTGAAPSHVARWNGTAWSAIDTGLSGPVYGLATLPNGDRVAVGAFSRSDAPTYPTVATVTAGLARLTTSCPVGVGSVGAGCSGAGGANALTATTSPWIGSTYVATATGMPPFGLAIDVHGFAPVSVPLASVIAEGLPGCDLLVAPDSLHLLLPAAGAVEASIVLPNSPAIAGLVFYQQVVAIELDGTGAITGLTSTNALELTIGAY